MGTFWKLDGLKLDGVMELKIYLMAVLFEVT